MVASHHHYFATLRVIEQRTASDSPDLSLVQGSATHYFECLFEDGRDPGGINHNICPQSRCDLVDLLNGVLLVRIDDDIGAQSFGCFQAVLSHVSDDDFADPHCLEYLGGTLTYHPRPKDNNRISDYGLRIVGYVHTNAHWLHSGTNLVRHVVGT